MIKSLFAISVFLVLGCAAISKKEEINKTSLVIGTIHKDHLKETSYPVQSLKTVISLYKPDLVLVEIRPDKFKSEQFEDGPFEMTYITLIARDMGIQVEGIDQWTELELQKELREKPNQKLDQEFQKYFESIKKAPEPSTAFEYIHSSEKIAEHTQIINLRKMIYGGNPEWSQRQAWFHYNAAQILNQGKYKRVLAFVGYEHRLELSDFLNDLGWRTEDPIKYSPTPHLKNLESCVPLSVTKAWAEGAHRLSSQAQTLDEPLKSRIRSKAEYFQSAAKNSENDICKARR